MQQKLIINCLYSVVCHLSSALCHRPSTNVENPLQINLFMQNKPNVKGAQINVNSYMKSKYEKLDTWLSGKNKPNSNPILSAVGGFQEPKMNATLFVTKDCENKTALRPQKNKPKTNPILSAVGGFRKAKMSSKSLAKKSGHTRNPADKKNTLPCGTKLYILCTKILGI